MGGCRCSYKNCTNTTKTRENLHFFHYPVKQKERCRQWIENANKPHFYDLDEDQLRNKVICETHFEDCFFLNLQRKRLLQGAIPTLEGGCKSVENETSMKLQDVQVLPANADGTIFVLETNMQNNFKSEKVESYIYTNSGLVLPIFKSNENRNDNSQALFSDYDDDENEEEEEEEEIIHNRKKIKTDTEMFTNILNKLQTAPTEFRQDRNFDVYVEPAVHPVEVTLDKIKPQQKVAQVDPEKNEKLSEDLFSKSVGNKYVKKIKQHSKDIALLKRMLKTRKTCKKPTNGAILNSLKKQIPQTLHNLLNFNINGKCDFSQADLDFYLTIYSTSPQVYEILTEKYKWKLPNPEIFNSLATNKNNGQIHSDN